MLALKTTHLADPPTAFGVDEQPHPSCIAALGTSGPHLVILREGVDGVGRHPVAVGLFGVCHVDSDTAVIKGPPLVSDRT